jgi:mRNA interferase RelE/StbE
LPVKIEYKSSVLKDLKKIEVSTAKRILNKLERELSKDPDSGTPLKGEFKGLFKYRVGEYRVMYTKTARGILILRIAHRKKAYK